MSKDIQYIVDGSGKRTSVIVPYRDWEKLNEKYLKLRNKLDVLNSVRDGVVEVKAAREKGIELQSLSDFIDGC